MSSPSKSKPGKSPGLGLAELNAKYNPSVIIPAKIRAALKTLGEKALPSEEFRKLVGLSNLQLSQFAGAFENYQIVVKDSGRPRVLWAGTLKFAEKAREALSQ